MKGFVKALFGLAFVFQLGTAHATDMSAMSGMAGMAGMAANAPTGSSVKPGEVYFGSASLTLAEKDIPFTPGFGEVSFAEGPASDANKYINQGIEMLHCFHYIDALRSFRMAKKLDPDSISATTGMIISYINLDADTGVEYATKLIPEQDAKLATKTYTRKQQLWYDLAKALNSYYGMDPSAGAAITSTYKSLSQEFPNDVEVLTLASWLVGVGSTAPYIKALNINPNHVGAGHYLTHILENSGEFAAALPYAQKVASIATSSAHAQHMVGHLLPHLKRWTEANAQFEKANDIHLAWAKLNGVSPTEDWHYAHNLNLWGVASAGVSNFDRALKLLDEGCQNDDRACPDTMEAAISAGRLDYAEQVAAQFPGGTMKSYLAEIALLRGTKTWASAAADIKGLGNFSQILQAIYSPSGLTSSQEAQLAQTLAKYTHDQILQGGFDSWSYGFFGGLRIIQAAKKRGFTQVVDQVSAVILDLAPDFLFTNVNYTF